MNNRRLFRKGDKVRIKFPSGTKSSVLRDWGGFNGTVLEDETSFLHYTKVEAHPDFILPSSFVMWNDKGRRAVSLEHHWLELMGEPVKVQLPSDSYEPVFGEVYE